MNNNQLLLLIALLQVKHFAADFPLQTVYHLGKSKKGLDFVLPLASHCSVHVVLSALVLLSMKVDLLTVLSLAAFEFIAHFVIDRLKVSYKLPAGTWEAENKGKYLSKYYIAFGLDQLAHALTYVLMIYVLI